jgi:protein-disulfide isomerase
MRIQMTHKKMNDPTTGTNPTEAMKKAPENLRWILSVLTILGIVAIVIFLSRVTPDENQSADSASPLRAIGPETAEVTITEFADFGCISCKAWHQFGVREEILNQYGEQVRFV